MGKFSAWHWLIVLFMVANLAMVVHIAISPRSAGLRKALFVITGLLIPLIPYIVWLLANQSEKESGAKTGTRDAGDQAPRPEAGERNSVASGHSSFAHPDENSRTPIPWTNAPLSIDSAMSLQATVNEDDIYNEIANEIETGAYDKGLWTRLFAECNGEDNQTKVLYIKRRAEHLIAAEKIRLNNLVKERAADAERLRILKQQSEELANPELVSAVWNGNWSTARKLLREGTKPTGIDSDGNSLLDLARKRQDPQMIQLLESYGAT